MRDFLNHKDTKSAKERTKLLISVRILLAVLVWMGAVAILTPRWSARADAGGWPTETPTITATSTSAPTLTSIPLDVMTPAPEQPTPTAQPILLQPDLLPAENENMEPASIQADQPTEQPQTQPKKGISAPLAGAGLLGGLALVILIFLRTRRRS